MNLFGRVAICGAISEYNLPEDNPSGSYLFKTVKALYNFKFIYKYTLSSLAVSLQWNLSAQATLGT